MSSAIVDRIATAARGIEPEASLVARPLADDIAMAARGISFASRFAWAAALLATWIPARRATRIDPAITLRGD